MTEAILKQYDIWVADLNPSSGTEPGKIRPVIILQSDILNRAGHESIITCALSSQQRVGFSIIRLTVEPSLQNGLKKKSYILVDQIRTIDVSRLLERIGKLEAEISASLINSLKAVLTLP